MFPFSKLSDLLPETLKKAFKSEHQKEEIQRIIKSITGILVSKDQFSIKNGTIEFRLPAVLKSELFIHKRKLLTELNLLKIFEIR